METMDLCGDIPVTDTENNNEIKPPIIAKSDMTIQNSRETKSIMAPKNEVKEETEIAAGNSESKTGSPPSDSAPQGCRLLHEMLLKGTTNISSLINPIKVSTIPTPSHIPKPSLPDVKPTSDVKQEHSVDAQSQIKLEPLSTSSSPPTSEKFNTNEDSMSNDGSFQVKSPFSDATSLDETSTTSTEPIDTLLRKERHEKKTRRRGTAWSDEETEFLLEIWARQAELVKEKGEETATCAAVYRLIAREMATKNYDKSWEQCKTRIHTLKRAYKITNDEISSGAKQITYCRHYDKLGIINLDNPEISPGVLAATLEKKRIQRETECKTNVRTPVKRKLVVGEPPKTTTKQSPPSNTPLPSFSTFNTPAPSAAPSVSGNVWYPPTLGATSTSTSPASTQSALQLSLTAPLMQVPSYQQYTITNPQPPPYSFHDDNSNAQNAAPSSSSFSPLTDANKTSPAAQSESTFRDPNLAQPQQLNTNKPKGQGQGQGFHSDLERMKLDLEMRRLEVEKDKIEMEERQRREERDHQYRMMQLLLFGLGQQNISQLLAGQGSEVAHAHNPDLSRALESGLVPGGQQTVNEKGLSFSEL